VASSNNGWLGKAKVVPVATVRSLLYAQVIGRSSCTASLEMTERISVTLNCGRYLNWQRINASPTLIEAELKAGRLLEVKHGK
jgi:hypothetical protein